jgi:hypothetical protein
MIQTIAGEVVSVSWLMSLSFMWIGLPVATVARGRLYDFYGTEYI